MANYDYPFIVIGAGAGGLVVAIGLAKAGKKVLLVERGSYGGDCTNYGCIPSKTLIASANVAHAIRHADRWGVEIDGRLGDTVGALRRVREVVQGFVDEEGPSALAEHGVETLTGLAAFVDAHTLKIDLDSGSSRLITGGQIVIATGSYPFVPPVPGLDEVAYLTNETIFNIKQVPKSMGIIGGGAIGCELAQAFQRLGCQVTIIEYFDNIMVREEPEARELLENNLSSEGITLQLGHTAEEVRKENGRMRVPMRWR